MVYFWYLLLGSIGICRGGCYWNSVYGGGQNLPREGSDTSKNFSGKGLCWFRVILLTENLLWRFSVSPIHRKRKGKQVFLSFFYGLGGVFLSRARGKPKWLRYLHIEHREAPKKVFAHFRRKCAFLQKATLCARRRHPTNQNLKHYLLKSLPKSAI